MAVTLINPFEVPEGREQEALKDWEAAAVYLRQQPGFISTNLHQAVSPGAKFHFNLHQAVSPGAKFHFINVAKWESAEAFQAAVTSAEFQALIKSTVENFPHYPALYEVIRE
jgi:heme-degrading monooxygenase HmoA